MVPKVTVLMAVYNAERFLAEAVSSILSQSFHDFEFLIVNDGSTDRSPAVLAGFKDPRLRLIDNKVNLGLTPSLNIGLREARGEYVARMDADDVSLPKRLGMQAAYLDGHPGTALVGANIEGMDADGKTLWRSDNDGDPDVIAWQLLFHNHVSGHGLVMFRRDAALAAGGYDEGCRCSQDFDLWARLSQKHNLAILPQVLLRWRSHPDSVSSKGQGEQERTVASRASRRLSELAGVEVGPELAWDLRLFCVGKFDGLGSPLRIHRVLSQVLPSFVAHRLAAGLSPRSPESKLRAVIARGFRDWSSRVDRRRHPLRRLSAWTLAARWDPAAVLGSGM